MFKIFKRDIDAMKRVEDINRMSEMGDAIEELRRMVEGNLNERKKGIELL